MSAGSPGELECLRERAHQHLLSRTGRVEDIERVYSHPQSLAQCRAWLRANLPGVEMLELFARNGSTMTGIESRPGYAGPSHYGFFIGIDGHVHDAAMERALAELADFTQEVRVLGSYPLAIT